MTASTSNQASPNNVPSDGHDSNTSSSISSDSGTPASFGVPTPPSTPPSIKFDPALSVQRRIKVCDILKEISKNYEEPIQSLLEVGCGGNTPLIQNLLTCDDDLPLSLLSGIDIDDDLFTTGIHTAFTKRDYGEDDGSDRWRDLTISLVHGSFEDLTLQNMGKFDAITSCEVIEHLDPGPLAAFAPVLLGRMNPKVLIVTTPNRDFNAVFEMPFRSLEDVKTEKGEEPYTWDPHDDPQVATRRYYRAPHAYAMRHHDHRFEWTRREFQQWGNEAADRFGYSVTYDGCGALKDGAEIRASRWRVDEALRRQLKNLNIDLESDQSIGTELLGRAFGHCSQIAIFIRNDLKVKTGPLLNNETPLQEMLHCPELTDVSEQVEDHIRVLNRLPNSNLRLVKYHTFTKGKLELNYPPSLDELFTAQKRSLKLLLPVEIQGVWQYDPPPHSRYRKWDCDVVAIHTDLKTLWDNDFGVRRACRFHFGVFEHLMRRFVPGPEGLEGLMSGLKLGVEADTVRKDKQYAVVTLDLEPVRESAPMLVDKADSSDDSSSETGSGVARSSAASSTALSATSEISHFDKRFGGQLKYVRSSYTILSKVYWQPGPKNGEVFERVPESIFLTEALRDPSSRSKILILNELVDSMVGLDKVKKRCEENGEIYVPKVKPVVGIPITLVFYKPEREVVEEFDYKQQSSDVGVGQGLNTWEVIPEEPEAEEAGWRTGENEINGDAGGGWNT